MRTKENIVATALRLFNQQGTKAVSTNHIAKAAGISPGNLYYHFSNKEAIILELYRQMRTEVGFESAPLPEDICTLLEYCRFVAQVWWKYRFLKKELVHLIERDPVLKKEVIADAKEHYRKLMQLVEHFVQKQCLCQVDAHTQAFLATAIAMLSNFWSLHWMLMGQRVDVARAAEVTHAVVELLRPYLCEDAKRRLRECEEVAR